MKRTVMLISIVLSVCVFAHGICLAQVGLPEELINIPTAYTLQRGDLAMDFRVYDGGGLITKVRLGLVDMLTLGLSLSVDGMIGSGNLSIPKGRPGIIAKVRIFDEMTAKAWPTITLAYDDSDYAGMMGKGVYVMASREFLIGKMFLHAHGGVNRSIGPRGENVGIGVFVGVDFSVTPQFMLIGEMEPVYPYASGSMNPPLYLSYNFGLQYLPIPNLRIGFFTKSLIYDPGKFIKEIHIGYITKLF